MRKFNAFWIKLFMALLMVLDHLNHIPNLISPEASIIFHLATRCVGVWFAYMAVEGFMHTRNKMKYNIRLGVWAVIMLVGNYVLQLLFISKEIFLYNNIFLTLALGVLVLNILNRFNEATTWQKLTKIILAIVVSVFSMTIAEGAVVMIPFIIISYCFREEIKTRNILYFAFAVFLLITSYAVYETPMETMKMLLQSGEWLFISVIPFIYLYNGHRGRKNVFTKYFFYVFYPAHLWIIALIAFMVK